MNDLSEEVFDSLETFISLKQQKLIIYVWMEIKKLYRKSTHGSRQSRSRSVRSHSIFTSEKDRDYIKEDERSVKSRKSVQKINNYNLQYSRPMRTPTDFIVQSGQRNRESMYNTFGKMPTSMRSSKNVTPQTSKYQQYTGQQRHVYTHGHQDGSVSDEDEFEDIILDRLTKLEENVNRIMREKRQKELERGYVGAPITPQLYSGKSRNNEMINGSKINAYLADAAEQNIRAMQNQLRSSKQDLMLLMKAKENISNKGIGRENYESQGKQASQSSMRSSQYQKRFQNYYQQQEQQKQGNSKQQLSKAIKYIPMSKQPQVNIERIRQIVQKASKRSAKPKNQDQTNENQIYIIQKLNFGGQQEEKKYVNRWDNSFRSEQNTCRINDIRQSENKEDFMIDRNRDALRKDRKVDTINQATKGKQKNQLQQKSSKNMIHYVPSHVEMRSTIEGMKNKKYFRNSNNGLNKTQDLKSNQSFDIPNNQAQKSKISRSDHSRVSYQTSKLNNLSSYY